jgi:hypothetical protein
MSRASGKFSYAVLCAAGLVLAATGIGTFALGKAPMTHWVLMAHVAGRAAFRPRTGRRGADLVRPLPRGRGFASERSRQGAAVGVLLTGLVVTLSGVVPMTPLVWHARPAFALLDAPLQRHCLDSGGPPAPAPARPAQVIP